MGKQLEIRLSGSGGQGLILAAGILAEALVAEGRSAAQSQSYEPTSRGGLSRSDLVVSDGEADYPLVTCMAPGCHADSSHRVRRRHHDHAGWRSELARNARRMRTARLAQIHPRKHGEKDTAVNVTATRRRWGAPPPGVVGLLRSDTDGQRCAPEG